MFSNLAAKDVTKIPTRKFKKDFKEHKTNVSITKSSSPIDCASRAVYVCMPDVNVRAISGPILFGRKYVQYSDPCRCIARYVGVTHTPWTKTMPMYRVYIQITHQLVKLLIQF